MHGTFNHFGGKRPRGNILTEDAMFYALQEVYAGQPVIFAGKPTFVQFVKGGLAWLTGFASPVPVGKIEAC